MNKKAQIKKHFSEVEKERRKKGNKESSTPPEISIEEHTHTHIFIVSLLSLHLIPFSLHILFFSPSSPSFYLSTSISTQTGKKSAHTTTQKSLHSS